MQVMKPTSSRRSRSYARVSGSTGESRVCALTATGEASRLRFSARNSNNGRFSGRAKTPTSGNQSHAVERLEFKNSRNTKEARSGSECRKTGNAARIGRVLINRRPCFGRCSPFLARRIDSSNRVPLWRDTAQYPPYGEPPPTSMRGLAQAQFRRPIRSDDHLDR